MKDFSALGSVLSTLEENEVNHHLRKALNLAASIANLGSSLPSRYSSLYAAVQMVKYKEDGTPEDITDVTRQSIPNYQCQLELKEAKRLQALRDSLTNPTLSEGMFDNLYLSGCDIQIGPFLVANLKFEKGSDNSLELNKHDSVISDMNSFDIAFGPLSDVMSFSGGAEKAKIARCRLPAPKYSSKEPLVYVVYMVKDAAVTESTAGVFVVPDDNPTYYDYAPVNKSGVGGWMRVQTDNLIGLAAATIPHRAAETFVSKLLGRDVVYSNNGPTYCADVKEPTFSGAVKFDVLSLVPNPDQYIAELENLI